MNAEKLPTIAKAIKESMEMYHELGGDVIISVDGTEYALSESSNLGSEIILHAEID